jgi:hypothetical protein
VRRLIVAIVGFGMLMLAPAAGAASVRDSWVGADISYPQCAQTTAGTLPKAEAFWILGLNGGNAKSPNDCFGTEWTWAAGHLATPLSNQAPLTLYVNTGNPGDVLPSVATWPMGPVVGDPYGVCAGANDAACAWVYGYDRAEMDITSAKAASPDVSKMQWWLDVETVNSWSDNQANNRADLEGMIFAFKQSSAGGFAGIYSTKTMWNTIAGHVPLSDASGLPSSLYNLNEWVPGATSLQSAQQNCGLMPFAGGGRVLLTQYGDGLDLDYRCPGTALR